MRELARGSWLAFAAGIVTDRGDIVPVSVLVPRLAGCDATGARSDFDIAPETTETGTSWVGIHPDRALRDASRDESRPASPEVPWAML